MNTKLFLLIFTVVISTVFMPIKSIHGELTGEDRLKSLYGTKLDFTQDKVPIIKVGIIKSTDRVNLITGSDVILYSSEKGGLKLKLKGRHKFVAKLVHTKSSKKGTIAYYPILQIVSAKNFGEIPEVKKKFEKYGYKVKIFERGRVFGFFGKLFDNREFVVVVDKPFATKKDALKQAENLIKNKIIEIKKQLVYPEIKSFPVAKMKIIIDGKLEIESDSVIFIKPLKKNGFITIKNVEFGKGFSWHGFEDRKYKGIIYITFNMNAKLVVGNMIDTETLLEGVLPGEIYQNAPLEALKAQAVTARVELLSKIGLRHNIEPFHICADVHCQVYKGKTRINRAIRKAINDTKGELLFYKNMKLIDAYYHSSCGGFTEKPENVWKIDAKTKLQCVFDGKKLPVYLKNGITEKNIKKFIDNPPFVFDKNQKFSTTTFRWTKKVSEKKIRENLKKLFHISKSSPLTEIKVVKRGCSGRVSVVKLVFKNSDEVKIQYELNIRRVFDGLKSSLFYVKKEKEYFVFKGGGFGHGIGMCQTGAIGRANAGQNYRQILKSYYKGASIIKIY